MHELAVTTSLVEAVADRFGDRRVVAVRLEVGRLSGVVTDAVRFCFDAVAAGTTLDGARLDVDEPDGHGRCRTCGAEVAMPDLLAVCVCGGVEIDVTDGRQLLVRAVELAATEGTEGADGCAEPAAATAR